MVLEEEHKSQYIGDIPQKVIDLFGISLPTRAVTIPPGAIKHVKSKRPKDFELYFDQLKYVIENPDYIGMYRDSDKFEMIKLLDNHLLVGLSIHESRVVISSFYRVTWVKVETRLKRGRLKKVE